MEEHIVDIEERLPSIFRVHEELRNVNINAYTPKLVSIGPYHYGQPKLLAMEKHKERYLKLVLQLTNRTEEYYLDSMKKFKERARKYYADPVDLDSDNFVKMMLYDACFIVHFLVLVIRSDHAKQQRQQGQQSQDVGHDYDPIVNTSWMRAHICCDLMLLENQLPFFVIFEFLSLVTRTQNPPSTSFMKMAAYPMPLIIPRKNDYFRIDLEDASVSESKHFLDLLRKVYHPPSSSREKSNECHCFKMPFVTELQNAGKHFLDLLHNVYHPSSSSREKSNECHCFKLPSVIELQDAGINFEAVEDEDDKINLNIFDISFKDGHFKIPKFDVDDWTETFFRNIIAYEQHSSDDKPQYFTDYTYFMDLLINSKEDVKQLRRHDVLDNWLGDDEEVALMFNKLGHGRMISDQFYYAKICSEVNAHCKRWWNRRKALLKRDYFKNMWVTVATMAAFFLLLLTLTQTAIALITIIISPPSRH